MTTVLTPQNLDEVRQAILASDRILARGQGTKTALSSGANLSLAGMSGILEYTPSEYTFTALAGTPLAEIRDMLTKNGQFLPFDPPLIEAGATLGGTTAAGLSGSARFRYGGIRDFLLGVRMVTGAGRVVFGGGKVVKNAAGFDFPKLLAGSLGQLAIMVELTFKVFPAPAGFRTVRMNFDGLDETVKALNRLATSQVELFCLDLEPPNTLLVRAGGLLEALDQRVQRVAAMAESSRIEILDGEADAELWRDVNEFRWADNDTNLAKLSITPLLIPQLEQRLAARNIRRHYGVGGNVALLAWDSQADEIAAVQDVCQELERPGTLLRGESYQHLGPQHGQPLLDRLNSVFDPDNKLVREVVAT